MPKPLTLLLLCSLMILSVSCRLPIPIVDAECDSVTSCLPQASLSAPSIPVLEAGCDVITAAPLRELIQDDEIIANAIDEIIRRFELPADELHIEAGEQYVRYIWRYLGNRYRLYIREGEKPLGYVIFEKSVPPLKQIVACLGEPEWYTSGYASVHHLFSFNVEFYFPDYGLVATSAQMSPQRNIVINENLPTSDLRLAPSGTVEEVVSFLEFDSPEVAQIILEQLKPWPGSLEIVIETIQADYCLDYPEFCPINEP